MKKVSAKLNDFPQILDTELYNNLSMRTNQYGLTGGLLLSSFLAFSQSNSPNIVVILADDMGWSSLSTLMDKRVPDSKSDFHLTPNIDRLASQGVRFTNGYSAAAVCSPTRYSIQTGQSPARINHVYVGQPTKHINHDAIFSLAKMLKAANPSYATAHFGKWHIGCDPSAMGYDFSDGRTSNKEGAWTNANTWVDVNTKEDPKLAFSLTERSINFIKDQKALNKPFFLQLSHYATHKEIISTQASYSKFEALKKGEKHNLPTFAAMLFDMDQSIGKLLTSIEELGISDNTYIFFITDNGGVPFFPPDNPESISKKGIGFNSPLRGGKWEFLEGGIRVPFIVKGPGIKANSFCNVPVITYDILPTIADIVNYKEILPTNIDGKSIKPLLAGNKKFEDRSLYFHIAVDDKAGKITQGATSCIRDGNFKLIKYRDNAKVALFDLKNDIGEQNDISKKEPAKSKMLEEKLDSYLISVNAFGVSK